MKTKQVSPQMKRALVLLDQNRKHGVEQTGVEDVLAFERDPRTGRRVDKHHPVTIRNQTLQALVRRGLAHSVLVGFSSQLRHCRWRWYALEERVSAGSCCCRLRKPNSKSAKKATVRTTTMNHNQRSEP